MSAVVKMGWFKTFLEKKLGKVFENILEKLPCIQSIQLVPTEMSLGHTFQVIVQKILRQNFVECSMNPFD